MQGLLRKESSRQLLKVDDLHEAEVTKVSKAERLRQLLRLLPRVVSFNWFCVCVARRVAIQLRALTFLAVLESMTVLGISAYIIGSAYTTVTDVSRGVYFPGILMWVLIAALWTFLLSSLKRENTCASRPPTATAPASPAPPSPAPPSPGVCPSPPLAAPLAVPPRRPRRRSPSRRSPSRRSPLADQRRKFPPRSYELIGAVILSGCTCGVPLYMMLRTVSRAAWPP